VRVSLRPAAVLIVESSPSHAEVRVDGVAVGRTPLSVSVAPGARKVELALDGYVAADRTVRVEGGQRAQLDVRLQVTDTERQRLGALQAAQRTQAEAELRHQEALKAHDARYAPQIQQRRRKSIRGYTTLGVGAALVATAAILYGVGAGQGGDAHDAYMREADTAPPSDLAALDQHRSDIESARAKVLAGHVLMSLGAAVTGVAIYLLATRPGVPEGPSPEPDQTHIGLAPTAHGALFVISGEL
jgi:hypothetical protein